MDAQSYQCPNCGQALSAVNIDFKTRHAHCDWCNTDSFLARSTLNSSDKVLNEQKNAVRFFLDKNFDGANRYAEMILNTAIDNAIGLFIVAYYKAFVAPVKSRDLLHKFFNETLGTIDFEAEELGGFEELCIAAGWHVGEYEDIILHTVLACDRRGAAEFMDAFSPHIIVKRYNMDWCNESIFNASEQITRLGNTPKTWYALYVSIAQNPDSPYSGNTFYLKTKTARFYNEYVLRVGKVFEGIQDEKLRAKFGGAYLNKKREYISKMEEGGN